MTLQEELQNILVASIPVGPPPVEHVVTSYRTLGVTFAKQVTDDVSLQSAQVAVQTCPRDASGLLDESSPQTLIIDGPEGYALAGFIMFGLTVIDSPYAQDVEAVLGTSIVGLTFTEAAPYLKIYSDRKKAARLAEMEN